MPNGTCFANMRASEQCETSESQCEPCESQYMFVLFLEQITQTKKIRTRGCRHFKYEFCRAFLKSSETFPVDSGYDNSQCILSTKKFLSIKLCYELNISYLI